MNLISTLQTVYRLERLFPTILRATPYSGLSVREKELKSSLPLGSLLGIFLKKRFFELIKKCILSAGIVNTKNLKQTRFRKTYCQDYWQ